MSWDVEVPMSWDEYVRCVQEHLSGFTSGPDHSRAAHFVKTPPGDTHTLRIEPLSDGPPLRVRVEFDAFAD